MTATDHLLVKVSAAGYERYDKPVEAALPNLGERVPVRVEEIDMAGRVIAAVAPFQFDRETADGAGNRLTFMMAGATPATATRSFRVSLGETAPPSGAALVSVSEAGEWQGQESFKIATPSATYVYHKQGAGFASLIDRDGADWISYRPSGGSAGRYRGIPNLGVCGHPGYTNSVSRVINNGPLVATIHSETTDGAWAFAWDIFPHYARLTILRAGGKYWFLYEGTPAGKLDLPQQYCMRSPGVRTPAEEVWSGDLLAPEWVYFGDEKTNRIIYLVHHEDDDQPDQYWPMENNMTVFGFGRIYRTIERFMERAPEHFTVGLSDGGDQAGALKAIDAAFRDLHVDVSG